MLFSSTKLNIKGGHGFCERDLFRGIIGEGMPFDQTIAWKLNEYVNDQPLIMHHPFQHIFCSKQVLIDDRQHDIVI